VQPFDCAQGCVLSVSEGRSFATLGQNKRPREKQSKTGPANFMDEKIGRGITTAPQRERSRD